MFFSQTSMDRLSTCHSDLRVLFIEVDAMGFECSILCGEAAQFDGAGCMAAAFFPTALNTTQLGTLHAAIS